MRTASGALVRMVTAIASGEEVHLPSQITLPPPSTTQSEVCSCETSSPTYCSMPALHTPRYSAYRSQFVVVADPWHPLHGQQVRGLSSNNRANSDLPRGRAVAMPVGARHGRLR